MLALLALLLPQAPESAPPTRFDMVIALAIDAQDALLEGHGHSELVEYVSEFSGTLHVWTHVEADVPQGELDICLRVEEVDGKLVREDDDSGGGSTPYIKLEVERGRRLIVRAAVSKGESTGKLDLHLVAAPETEATQAAAEEARLAIAEVRRLHGAKDLDAARGLAVKTLDALVAVPGGEGSERVSVRLWELGFRTNSLAILGPTRDAWSRVLRHRSRTLPERHADLQFARQHVAVMIKSFGDFAGARALEEEVLAVRSRTLPEENPDLLWAQTNLAVTLHELGDLHGAHALFEKVFEVRSRTLPDDHPDLQAARANLALTTRYLGDLPRARALQEKVLAVLSRTLPEEHPDLQAVRGNLGSTLESLGDLDGARALFEKVLAVDVRMLPDDHPHLQLARSNLAETIESLGDLQGARALQEKVLEVSSRTLPDDHPDLQRARHNLAMTMRALGDLWGARALLEKVYEVHSRTLPDEHPLRQAARANLAGTMKLLGDLDGARALIEQVLAVEMRTLPEDHPYVQMSRLNLAATFKSLGDLESARALEEQALEVLSRTMPDEHPNLQAARRNLALTILGQAVRARSESGERVQSDEERARERCAELVAHECRAQLRSAKNAQMGSSSREAEERCVQLAESLDLSISLAGGYGVFEPIADLDRESFLLSETTRGAALAAASSMRAARGSPEYAEQRRELRHASDELAALVQRGTDNEEFQRALARREDVERAIALTARSLSETRPVGLELETLVGTLEERDAVVAMRAYTRSTLETGEERDASGHRAVKPKAVESLCAFVLRPSTGKASGIDGSLSAAEPVRLVRVELGPIAAIEAAVRDWRASLGVTSGSRGVSATGNRSLNAQVEATGARLRQLVFDPLRSALQGADHVILAADDVVHLVPLDALPADDRETAAGVSAPLLGQRWRIEMRVTLAELIAPAEEHAARGELVVVGDVSYGSLAKSDGTDESPPLSRTATTGRPNENPVARPVDAEAVGAARFERRDEEAGLLRGGAWSRGFIDLPGSGIEARGIVDRFREQFGTSEAGTLLGGADATCERLFDLARRARWLHIATHGWFATESVRSWSDAEPVDKQSGLGARMSGEEQVKGMRPMLLCGLALAGANLPEDATGRMPGLVTAEELSTLDLSNCELVVLSACDTNVGERRAGQGVASLQKALQMAGARSVITSLWKVPDEATKELMLDFYRRLWVEKKPKHQALWEAKMKLREAKDESGAPKYTTRDWAAWVLTGDPN